MKTSEEIQEWFKEKFKPIDNIPRDDEREAEIILKAKASLLIRSAIGMKRFDWLMKKGPTTSDDVYEFAKEQEIEIELPATGRGDYVPFFEFTFNYKLKAISLAKSRNAIKGHSLEAVCRPYFPVGIANAYRQTTPYTCYLPGPASDSLGGLLAGVPEGYRRAFTTASVENEAKCFAAAMKQLSQFSLLDICARIDPRIDLDWVFSRLESERTPYESLKIVSDSFRQDCFFDYDSGTEFTTRAAWNWQPENISAIEKLEMLLKSIALDPAYECTLDKSFENASEGFYKGVYAFKKGNGHVSQLVVKLFDWKRQTKILLPCTLWNDASQQGRDLQVFVPLQKQILFNLDKILNQPDAIVILTDSVEIASKNQSDNPKSGCVWTSWLCDEEKYEQVDWSPLKERDVYYLITNHSGISLEEQCIKAMRLAEFLEKEGNDISLKFILIATTYAEKKYGFTDLGDFEDYWSKNHPEPIEESVKVLTMDGFFALLGKAEARLNQHPIWQEDETQPVQSGHESNMHRSKKKREPVSYLMRPIIRKGDVSFLCAVDGAGKSGLAISLCASIISGKSLFDEVWWSVPSSIGGKTKILYFDFETKEKDFYDRMNLLFYPYLSGDKEKQELLRQHFLEVLFKDKELSVDFLSVKGQDFVMDRIKELEGRGDQEAPVRLVVFDTYTKTAGGLEYMQSWQNMGQLIKKITSYRDNPAILFVHHLNDDNNMRGRKEKRQEIEAYVKIIKETTGSYETTARMIMGKNRFSEIDADFLDFEFALDKGEKRWKVSKIFGRDGMAKEQNKWEGINPDDYKKEFFCELVNGYTKGRFLDTSIFKMLGMGNYAFYEMAVEYGLRQKKNSKSDPE